MSWDEVFMHPIFNGNFEKYAEQNREFENKLKLIMNDLRFKINSQNIDLNKLIQSLGFDKDHELKFK
jgi:hypothetical protein